MCLMAWKLPIGRPNWIAGLGVVDGELQRPARAAGLLAGQRDARQVQRPLDRRPAGAALAQRPWRASAKAIRASRSVWSKVGSGGDLARSRGVDLEPGDARAVARGDQQRAGVLAVDDVAGDAVQRPAVARRGGGDLDAVRGPVPPVAGERGGGDARAVGDAGSRRGLRGVVAGLGQQRGGQHRAAEQRRAEQRRARPPPSPPPAPPAPRPTRRTPPSTISPATPISASAARAPGRSPAASPSPPARRPRCHGGPARRRRNRAARSAPRRRSQSTASLHPRRRTLQPPQSRRSGRPRPDRGPEIR